MSETPADVIARAERMGCGYTINGDEHVFCDDERLKVVAGSQGLRSLWNPGECECKTKAGQIIAALEAAGYAVVPKELSDDTGEAVTHILVEALKSTRETLLLSGFVGPGHHGSGDPEIKRIDDALMAVQEERDK